MMNTQQLDEFTAAVKHHFGDDNRVMNAASFGAMWQEKLNADEIARLEAEKAELLDVLETAFERIVLALQDIKTVGMSAIPRDIKAVTEISMLLEKHGRI